MRRNVKNYKSSLVSKQKQIISSKISGARYVYNRETTQQSWEMFFEMLEYKLIRNGLEIIKVEPKYTYQTCNECGHISKK